MSAAATWQAAPMEARWDPLLEAWTANAAVPGSDEDPEVGPAGPAGVATIRRGTATVSFCVMTGRVVSLSFDDGPGPEERALLDAVVDGAWADGPPDDGPTGATLPLSIRPRRERVDLVRFAILEGVLERWPPGPGSAAEVLILAERAAVASQLAAAHPELVRGADASDARTAAEDAAEGFGSDRLTDRAQGGLTSPLQFAADLRRLIDELTATGDRQTPLVQLLRDAVDGVDGRSATRPGVTFLGGMTATASWSDEAPPVPASAWLAPRLRPTRRTSAPQGHIEIAVTVQPGGTLSPLGELASRQFGFAPSGASAETSGHWCTVSVPLVDNARHTPDRWILCKGNGTVIGAAPLEVGRGVASAHVAVAEAPDEFVFTTSPVPRDALTSTGAALSSLDRLSKVAWWAHQIGSPGAAEMFSLSAVGWFELGQVFRAAWAASLADPDLTSRIAAGRAGRAAAAVMLRAMEAVVSSGDLPPMIPDQSLRPCWVHVAGLGDGPAWQVTT